jgi:hypothetical protein
MQQELSALLRNSAERVWSMIRCRESGLLASFSRMPPAEISVWSLTRMLTALEFNLFSIRGQLKEFRELLCTSVCSV